MIESIVRLAAEVMEAYSVVLFIAREDGLAMACAASLSRNLRRGCVLAVGEGLVGWIHREKKPVVAHNFHHDSRTLQFYRKDETIKSFLGLPLTEQRGVLCIDSKKNYRFTDKKIKIANMFALLISNEISRQEVKKEKEKILKRLLLINNIYEIKNSLFEMLLSYSCLSKLDSVSGIRKDAKRKFISHMFNSFDCDIAGITTLKGTVVLQKSRWIENTSLLAGGLVGLVVKSGGRIFMNDRPGITLYEEPVSGGKAGPLVDNFCGVPLAGEREGGCFFLVKKKGGHWQPSEVALVEEAAGLLCPVFGI